MQNYILMTDSDSDLPYALKVQHDIPVVYMPYTLDGKEYYDDLGQSLDHKSFFDAMRNGAQPTTAALNQMNYEEYFEPILKEGKDILFLAFSSQLSGTINSLRAAREALLETYPERTFIVVDTLSISGPQTLLVLKAQEMYEAGASIEDVAAWVEANKLRAHAYFTVDDLKYLQRGGRVSATAAALGAPLVPAAWAVLIGVFCTPLAVATTVISAEMGSDHHLASQILVWSSIGSLVSSVAAIAILRTVGLL